MAHPFHKAAKEGHKSKLASYGGKSKGMHFDGEHTYDGVPPINTDQQRGLAPLTTPPSLSPKTAGMIMRSHGGKAKHRLDRKPRAHGGRTGKGKTQVNVIVAGHGGGEGGGPQAVPVPHPVPVPISPPSGPPPMMPGMGAMPPGGMPPMAGGPAGLPPGLMRKRGGRVQDPEGNSMGKGSGPEGNSFGKGGMGENPQPMITEKFGSAGGLGRLEKKDRQAKADSKMHSKDNY